MSRRRKAEKREINPDPKFRDLVVSKFMKQPMSIKYFAARINSNYSLPSTSL